MNKLLVTLFASAFAFSVSAMAQTAAQQDNSMMPLSKMETQDAKAAREAAKAKWAKMTPEEQAAAKKAARGKKQADLTALDSVASENMKYDAKQGSAQAKAEKSQPKPTKEERKADVTQQTKPTTGQ